MQPDPTRRRSRAAPPTLQRICASLGTIRGRILIAALVVGLITGLLGGYALLGMRRAGTLVARTYDESLMSINFARAASADFAKMRAAFARRWTVTDAKRRAALDAEVTDLAEMLTDDISIAAERAQSVRASRAAVRVQEAVTAWDGLRRTLSGAEAPIADWEKLDGLAATADGEIDLLINYMAGDGFTYRQLAQNAVIHETRITVAATAAAILLSLLVACLLVRRIVGPVAAASAVAERIASGDLAGEIPSGGADEFGVLLRAMAAMRDNIRTMMEREVRQRRSAQARLADALETSREGVIVVDAAGHIVLANAQAISFFRATADLRRAGTPVAALAGATTDPAAAHALLDLARGRAAEGEIRLGDGRWLWVSRSATQEGGFVAVCSDISVLKEQESRLTATNLRLDAALDNMSQGLCLYDAESRLKVVNRRYFEIYGLDPGAVHRGMAAEEILSLSVEAGNHPGLGTEDLLAAEREAFAAPDSGPHYQELGNGRVVAILKRATTDGGFVATYEDVTERWHAEARIIYMARHDALTDLPNRVLLGERIESAIAGAGRDGGFAVLCLDLDNFKQVNDTLGHAVGDELLRAVGNRLMACLREGDTVARLGGDEFAIVQVGVERAEEAAVLARRIIGVVSAAHELTHHAVTVGVSIGIAVAPHDGMSADKLLKSADVALYRAKGDGRGVFRFFEADMDARLQARRQLELDLRAALAAEAFELHYQPIYDLALERIGGFEALLRWTHPTRGQVSPAEFVPLAEEIGLIVPLGEWVLRRACLEAAGWPDGLKVAVNVSAAQFTSAHLIGVVRDALAESGLSPRRLELEITESVLLMNGAATVAMLHTLRGLGVRVSMDDFGTGYSSLSYLRSFPFDKIKIDQSFIRDLTAADGSGLIVRAVIELGSSLGMTTTAEGVETEEQLARLREEGCDEAQGYLFSKPVPAPSLPALLDRWNGTARAVA